MRPPARIRRQRVLSSSARGFASIIVPSLNDHDECTLIVLPAVALRCEDREAFESSAGIPNCPRGPTDMVSLSHPLSSRSQIHPVGFPPANTLFSAPIEDALAFFFSRPHRKGTSKTRDISVVSAADGSGFISFSTSQLVYN